MQMEDLHVDMAVLHLPLSSTNQAFQQQETQNRQSRKGGIENFSGFDNRIKGPHCNKHCCSGVDIDIFLVLTHGFSILQSF